MRLDEIADIISVRRDDEKTEDDFFTRAEREYCGKRSRCLGARYVIKKCVLDYLTSQTGYGIKSYREIEVVNNALGQPMLRVFGGVREYMNHLKIKDVFISISHSRNWVAGMVVLSYKRVNEASF